MSDLYPRVTHVLQVTYRQTSRMAWNKGKVEASQQHQKGDPKHNGLASGVADTILNE